MERGRLEAFSDGVIAVAITLLALNLFLPGPGHGSLVTQLGDRWPEFAAYVISFFTIGVVWVNHHEFVRNIAVIDRTTLFLNLLLLMFVVLIPVATGTMAQYLTAGNQDAHLSMALYCVVLEGMGLGFGAMFFWSLTHGGPLYAVLPEARRAVTFRFIFGSFAYLVAIVLAFVNPLISLAIVFLVAVYYIFDRTRATPEPGLSEESR